MITEITPSTTVAELTELIQHIEEREGKFIWLELYRYEEGVFCYRENEEKCRLVDIEDLEEYLDIPDKHFKLKCEIQDILQEDDGLKKLLTIIQDMI